MRKKLGTALLISGVVAGGAIGWRTTVADAGPRRAIPNRVPPPLPWVRADGTVDEVVRANTRLPVADPGKGVRRDAAGNPVTVRVGDMAPSPNDPPGTGGKRSVKDGVETVELSGDQLRRP